MFVEKNLIIFSILIAIIYALPNCTREKPLYKEGRCGAGLCTKDEYEQGICVIVNKIAKIQWVTSVILLGIPKASVYLQKNQKGDLILELLTIPAGYTRMLYELKQNEEALLVKDGEFIPYQTLNSDYKSKSDGNLYFIKIGEDEYPVYFGMYEFGIELYDLKEKKIYYYPNPSFFDGVLMNIRGTNLFLTNFTLNNENLYLFAYNSGDYTSIKIIKFNSKNLENDTSVINEINSFDPYNSLYCTTPISCFITDSKMIICLYSSYNYIYISAYDDNLVNHAITLIYQDSSTSNTYYHAFKCLHLTRETGVFLTYSKYIYVLTYMKDDNRFINYFPESDLEERIELSIDDEDGYIPYYYTDVQKISDSKVCYISFARQEKSPIKGYYLAVALLNFIGSESMIIRYYYIRMNRLYGYVLETTFKFSIYNNYIALCFDGQKYEEGYKTAFMLLSYANNTNQNFDIIDLLLYNNEIKISNITYDLKEHLKIENNVFGYKIQKSEILEKNNCEKFDMKFINNNLFIQANSQLVLDDTIFKIIFQENENDIYYKGNCTIRLNLFITDPDFDEYEVYTDRINDTYGKFDENTYNEQNNTGQTLST